MTWKTCRTGAILIASLIMQTAPVHSQIFEKYDSTFLQLALWNPMQLAPDDVDVLGVRLNLFSGENRDLYGIDMGILNSLTRDMIGIQAGAANFTRCEMIGIQIGVDNVVGNMPTFGLDYLQSTPAEVVAYGLQLGALNLVYPKGTMNGLQLGLINVADRGNGLQIGIINCANYYTGIQIGLLNYNESAEFYLTPLINACF